MDLLDQIKAKATSAERTELDVAIKAKAGALAAFQSAPGKSTKEGLDAAGEFYQQTIDQLQSKYLPRETAEPEGERFTNRKQALNWLNAQGYKVGQDKFYTDCKAGFPQVHRDKSVSKYQVLQYGQQLDVKNRAGSELTEQDAIKTVADTRKSVADAAKAEMQAEQMKRELDKLWMHRADAELEICTWTALLRDAIDHRLNQALPALIFAAGGQADNLAEVQAIKDQAIIDACNDISNSGEVEVDLLEEEVDEC